MIFKEFRTQIRKIEKYKKKVDSGDGLNIKQQKEIIEAILQRPYAWTYEQKLNDNLIDNYDIIDWNKVKPDQTLEMVKDTGEIYLFRIKEFITKY